MPRSLEDPCLGAATSSAHKPEPDCTTRDRLHPENPIAAHLILQVPDAVLVGELFGRGPALGQDATLEAGHVEEQVGVVLAVGRDETGLPLEGGDGAGQAVLHVPEDGPATGDDR